MWLRWPKVFFIDFYPNDPCYDTAPIFIHNSPSTRCDDFFSLFVNSVPRKIHNTVRNKYTYGSGGVNLAQMTAQRLRFNLYIVDDWMYINRIRMQQTIKALFTIIIMMRHSSPHRRYHFSRPIISLFNFGFVSAGIEWNLDIKRQQMKCICSQQLQIHII